MRPLQLPDPRLVLAGERLACRLWLAYAGGYQLTLSSLLPALALELHSSYLGHPDGDTAVAHLLLTKQAGPQTDCQLRPGVELPVREARRRCLYDHLAQLQAALTDQGGGPARIELHDRTLELVDHA